MKMHRTMLLRYFTKPSKGKLRVRAANRPGYGHGRRKDGVRRVIAGHGRAGITIQQVADGTGRDILLATNYDGSGRYSFGKDLQMGKGETRERETQRVNLIIFLVPQRPFLRLPRGLPGLRQRVRALLERHEDNATDDATRRRKSSSARNVDTRRQHAMRGNATQ
ncbi:hypothetical protein BDN70DRAFT_919694 [Pholiota conissans]|uniref:Uncharacterized protein n=1 Tax=Pholiota conissans TaxID=109636 RepID=A0A9P5Z7N0_9AGAR|nr:hypothetical protein BDN70DRAFT_919694 [Pholiota conissans]